MTQRKAGLFRDLLTLSMGEVFAKGFSFLAFAYLARTLKPEFYGPVEFATAICLFAGLFIELGLGAVGVREVCHDRRQVASLASIIPTARVLLSLAAIPLLGACVRSIGQTQETAQLVWLFAISLLATSCTQTWLLQGLEMMGSVALTGLLRTIVFVVVIGVCVRGPEDLLSVGWAQLVAASCAAAFTIGVQHIRITPIRIRFSVSECRRLARRGIPLAMSQMVWAANQYVPVLLVAGFLDGLGTAFFGAANRVLVALLTFSHIYHFNLYPSMARSTGKSTRSITHIVGPSIRVVAWTTVPLALVLCLLARPILVLTYGSTFAPAAPAFAVLVWAFPVAVLSGHARCALIAAGREKHVLYAQMTGMFVTLVMGIVLIPLLREVGASIAVVSAALSVWAVAHVHARSITGDLRLLTIAARPAVLAIVVATCSLSMGTSSGLTIVLVVSAFTLCAPIVDSELLPDLKQLALAKNSI